MVSSVKQPVLLLGRNLQIGFWVIVFTITMYFSITTLGWIDGILRNVLVLLCHAVNFYVCYSLLMPWFLEKKKYGAAIGGFLLLYLALTPIRHVIEQSFVIPETSPSRFGILRLSGFVIFSQVVVSKFAILLRITVSNEVNRQRVILLQQAQLDAELKFLKAQMSPHFLFNTINNIYSLTLGKSDKAPEALMRLSGLLRYLLYESPGKVALARELDALQNYAELFQLRFEEPLNLVINVEVRNQDEFWIEPHLLIPILENTLKHSGLGADEKAFAVYSVLEDEKNIWVEVENSRISRTPGSPSSEPGGIALANIRKRLDLVYPGRNTFKVQEDNDRFSITMIVPKQ